MHFLEEKHVSDIKQVLLFDANLIICSMGTMTYKGITMFVIGCKTLIYLSVKLRHLAKLVCEKGYMCFRSI